jgi:hypothetical protein
MKKYLLLTPIFFFAISILQAQEYKLARKTGKLVIRLASVRVEGYDGNDIVFSASHADRNHDERANGLRPINGAGIEDNTGLGINVTEKENLYEVNPVAANGSEITIKVPKGVSVSYSYSKVIHAGKASFKNIESELDISVQHNTVELDNITGPLTAKAMFGGIDATFSDNIKGPVSITSVHGHVDVEIPAAAKTNLKMKTSHGEILASPDLKIELDKSTSSEMISYNNKDVRAKMNGGGAEFMLRSDHGKIYLRKK